MRWPSDETWWEIAAWIVLAVFFVWGGRDIVWDANSAVLLWVAVPFAGGFVLHRRSRRLNRDAPHEGEASKHSYEVCSR